MGEEDVDRSEGFGERLFGELLDRARLMPPQLIAPLVAEEVTRVGGRDVSILLQDYAQEVLVPLPGSRLLVGQPQPVAIPRRLGLSQPGRCRGAAGPRGRADVSADAGRQ